MFKESFNSTFDFLHSARRFPNHVAPPTPHARQHHNLHLGHHRPPIPLGFPTATLANILILLAIPILALLARLRPRAANPPLSQHLQPWRTKSWAALYGLLRLSYDNKWAKGRDAWILSRSLHAIWHHPQRPYLGRLLAMWVIPLSIHDGEMKTEKGQGWRFSWEGWLPGVQWPMYVHGRQRACFEIYGSEGGGG